ENYQWLDFGQGVQRLTPVALKLMTQRDIHFLRVFTGDDDATLAGVVGLTNVDRAFRTASVWTVLGNKRQGGCGRRATARLLDTDLLETGLLDSLLIVDLLLHIERELGRTLPMETLELEDFRTLVTIARCIERKGSGRPAVDAHTEDRLRS